VTDHKPVAILYSQVSELPPDNGTWLAAVNLPGQGCELLVSHGPDARPVTIRTGLPLDQALRHAAEVAADYGVDTIYVLGAVPS